MKCRCKVTFEFEFAPPLTWEGIVSATGLQTVASRAVQEAKKEYPNKQWSSVVVLVLQRLEDAEPRTITVGPHPPDTNSFVTHSGLREEELSE